MYERIPLEMVANPLGSPQHTLEINYVYYTAFHELAISYINKKLHTACAN